MPPEEHIAGASIAPIDDESSPVARSLTKASLHNPVRRLSIKERLDGSEYAADIVVAGSEEGEEPARPRYLVVIEKSDEIAHRVVYGLVPSQRDVLARLDVISDIHMGRGSKVANDRLSGAAVIVVDDEDGIGEPQSGLLVSKLLE
jgi:hypothetical protein